MLCIILSLIFIGSGYIHSCRNSPDINWLFTWQPFVKAKGLFPRLPRIKYEKVAYTACIFESRSSYLRSQGLLRETVYFIGLNILK